MSEEKVVERASGRSLGTQVMDFLASYGLAVFLLFCLFVLTFFGTLYQVDNGLYAAKKRYFESFFLWREVGGFGVPFFPGGMTVMGLLAVNMLCGGLIRLRISKRNLGVVVIHLGIAFMLVAGLVKLLTAQEGSLMFYEGEKATSFQSYHLWEVAVWEVAEPGETQVEQHLIRHDSIADLQGGRSRTFTSPELPFDLVLSSFVPNARPMPKGPMWESATPVVDGYGILERAPELEAEFNIAALHAEVRTDEGTREGLLWGAQRLPWTFEAAGRDWAVDLRRERYELPFELRLDDFEMERHPGTGIPEFFRSYVTKVESGEEERILIEMNEPLRKDNLVLFQTNWGPQQGGPHPRMYSVLTVVDNPSDKWPEYALWVITLGLVMAFGRKLRGFLRSQAKRHREAAAAG